MRRLKSPRVVIVGLGKEGSFHTQAMIEAGTNLVALVSRNKTGRLYGLPLYQSVAEAARAQTADWAILFVPAQFTKEAALEALGQGLNLVLIAEGVPVHDTLAILQAAKQSGLTVIGPNCPGLIAPGQFKLGIMPSHIFRPGETAIISRSGTLAYEIAHELTQAGLGQSLMLGIGGDPLIGFDFRDALEYLAEDPATKQIVLVGEIGGNLEELAAQFVKEKGFPKKIVAYIAGRTAPKEKKMGHAGAIVEGEAGTAESKIKAFREAGIQIAQFPSEIVKLLRK